MTVPLLAAALPTWRDRNVRRVSDIGSQGPATLQRVWQGASCRLSEAALAAAGAPGIFGRQASARRGGQALDASGGTPPLARIVASQLAGADALTVDFSCDCTEGAAPIVFYRWEFAEGALPPECRLSTAPPAGPAPLSTDLLSTFRDPDGTTVRNEVIFPDGERTGALQIPRAYEQPGRYTARLEVEDAQGLICEDRVEISATGPGGAVPPRILSVASTTASCGVAYRYSETGLPVAAGSGPLRFSVEGAEGAPAPQGFAVDPSTGEVLWTPGEVNGRVSAVLRVDGPGGTDLQPLEVDVDCPQARVFDYPVACSCDASAGLPFVLLLAAAVARRRQRCTR